MKKKIIVLFGFIMLCSCLFGTDNASAGWVAKFTATGQNLDGVKESHAYIGASAAIKTLEAAPEPPNYSVNMILWKQNWEGPFSKDIQKEGEWKYKWLIGINPHGNINPPDPRTSVISWNPAELGPGSFRMKEGYDGTGTIVVEDMKDVSSYDVTGTDAEQYFLIEYVPILEENDLGDVIKILQVLTGMNPSDLPSVDNNSKLGLPEAISILREIAGLK